MNVKDKVALLTGGLGGIALALAKELLRNGAKGVSLLDINFNNGIVEKLISEFTNDRVLVIQTDVTKKNEVNEAFETTVAKFKQLDIVVNCAAIISKDDFEKEVAVNYVAAYRIIMLAMEKYLPEYRSGNEGVIINFSSIAALTPFPVAENYGATKSGLLTLSRSLACGPLSKKNKVKFLTICPGLTDTPILQPLLEYEMIREVLKTLEMQSPDDLAKLIVPIIGKFESGDAYVCEENEAYKLKFHDRTESKEG